MKIIVLTIESELESAKNLGWETVTQLPFESDCEEYNNSIIIRWGNSRLNYNSKGYRTEYKNVINLGKNISANCHKYNALKKLAEVVDVPEFYSSNSPVGENYVIRPMQHTKGISFEIKKSPFDLNTWDYYATKFIKTDTEYRVWFCGDKTLLCRRVALKSLGNVESEFTCRSMFGYSFKNMIPELHNSTLKAAKHLGLEFGAADILYKDGKYYYSENNTAPDVDVPKLVSFFKSNLEALIKEKFIDKKKENPPQENNQENQSNLNYRFNFNLQVLNNY